jgi:serine/threonine-protein kinase
MKKCPDSATLQRLLKDQLPTEEFREIEAHVEECAACQTTLKYLLVGADVTTTPAGLNGLPDPLQPRAESGRYTLSEEIGRGGMGVVLRAHDDRLNRDLAVKVLDEKYREEPAVIRRFSEEAQIGGQLQHPGIVPVHDLGKLPDGRPFFAMKLVKGRRLDDLLEERPNPGHNLSRFLQVFDQICQTMAYAHSHHVIHRDLKPANIMVGAFGEVLVMDWGIAKVLTEAAPGALAAKDTDRLTRVQTERSATPGLGTGAGAVMGTYAYMAPEQARGQTDSLDERCDVWGLGAILCEVLTGQPPYGDATGEQLRVKALIGDVAGAVTRLDACGADPELVRLCKRCLAAGCEERPRDAADVAKQVAAYQAAVQERLRKAELERAAAQAREQEARATAAAERKARRRTRALAVAVLLLVAGGGTGAWLWQARAAELTQRQRETDAAAEQAMGEAQSLLKQAKAAPLDDLRRLVQEALVAAGKAKDLARPGEASGAVRQQAEDLTRTVESEAEAVGRDRRLLAALLEVRGPREGPKFVKDDRGLMMELAEPSADEQLQAAFRDWDPTFDVDALPTEKAAARLRGRPAAVVTEVIAALDQWSETRRSARPAGDWQRVAELASALDDPDARRRELRTILGRNNLEWERALGQLSMALRPVPVPFDAGLGHDRARLRQLASEVDAASMPVLGLLTLTRALRQAGDDAGAERLLREARRARPREVVLHYALGKLLEEQPPPRWGQAVECYAAARALRPDLGERLANAQVNGGSEDEGFALYERLVADRKDSPYLHFQRGYAFDEKGRHKEAEAAYREAIRLKPDEPVAHVSLGVALNDQGRHKEAEAAYREAIRLKPDEPEAHNNLGAALDDQGRHKEAEAACREAIRLKPDYPSAHYSLGNCLNGQGRHKEAEAAFREVIRLKPDYPEAHVTLGVALGHQGRHKEAEAAFREAIRLKPDYPVAYVNLGFALRDQGLFTQALQSLRRAHAKGSQTPGWRHPSADWVRACERLVELDRKLPAVLRGDAEPSSAVERLELAALCQHPSKRLHTAAARLYAAAFDADPKLASDLSRQHRYNAACSAALAAAGQAEDAKNLPDKVALMLRRQGLRWLQADLALYTKLADREEAAVKQAVRQRLAYWQKDTNLASVRDKAALDRLPEQERQQWRKLWEDVAALLEKVQPQR